MISKVHCRIGSCQIIESLALIKILAKVFTMYYSVKLSNFVSHVWKMHTGLWDAVVTCFFIDTAHNIIEYIAVISRILKDGGVRALSLSCKGFHYKLVPDII